MDLLLAIGIPALLLIVGTLLLSNGSKELRESLFRFEMSGTSSQIWTFGILFMSTASVIIYFFNK
jgi:hypothetical protein